MKFYSLITLLSSLYCMQLPPGLRSVRETAGAISKNHGFQTGYDRLGQNLIVYAASNGQIETVKLCLADPRFVDRTKFGAALVGAAGRCQTKVVELLLADARVDRSFNDNAAIKAASKGGCTAVVELLGDSKEKRCKDLVAAATSGDTETVKSLLADPQADPSFDHNQAIISAATNGHVKAVRLLMADKRVNPSDQNNKAISSAVVNGHVEVVEALLDDERVDLAFEDDYLIRRAFQSENWDMVKVLLTLSDYIDPSDPAILNSAVKKGQVEIVKLLLGFPEVVPSNEVLGFAKKYHMADMETLLAERRSMSAEEFNAIHLGQAAVAAIEADDIQKVAQLFANPRFDPSCNDNDGIVVAAGHGNLDIFELFFHDRAVDPSDQSNSAIILASKGGHLDIVDMLLHDSRVNPADQNNAALVAAAKEGHLGTLKCLLADPRVNPSDLNNLAFHEAVRIGDFDIAEELLRDRRFVLTDEIKDEINEKGDEELIQALNELQAQ